MPVATDQFTAAWERFFRTTRRLRARAGKRPLEGLSLPQYHLLEALRDADELTVGELAEARRRRRPDRHPHARLPGARRLRRAPALRDRPPLGARLAHADGRVAVEAAHEHVNAWRRRVFEASSPRSASRPPRCSPA